MLLIIEGNLSIVPAGLKYELVLVTNKNGSYYYYTQSGTIPHNGLTTTANMMPVSLTQVKLNLAAL